MRLDRFGQKTPVCRYLPVNPSFAKAASNIRFRGCEAKTQGHYRRGAMQNRTAKLIFTPNRQPSERGLEKRQITRVY